MTQNEPIKPGWMADVRLDTIESQLVDALKAAGANVGPNTRCSRLVTLLDEHAAPYTVFRTTRDHKEAILTIFAIPDQEQLQTDARDKEILAVTDLSQVPDDYTGTVWETNNHGNQTLYSADNGVLTEVWAVV